MNRKIFFTAIFLGLLMTSFARQDSTWNKWNWLIGDWAGEGSGQPGIGGGTFSFKTDLDQKILIRKSHSEYPAAGNQPKVVHDDLMIIYPDYSGNPVKAIYFDNEGHIINYSVSYSDKAIILTSEKIQNVPVFRLTYSALEDMTVDTKFEISQDGVKFNTYIEGKSKMIKQ